MYPKFCTAARTQLSGLPLSLHPHLLLLFFPRVCNGFCSLASSIKKQKDAALKSIHSLFKKILSQIPHDKRTPLALDAVPDSRFSQGMSGPSIQLLPSMGAVYLGSPGDQFPGGWGGGTQQKRHKAVLGGGSSHTKSMRACKLAPPGPPMADMWLWLIAMSSRLLFSVFIDNHGVACAL